MRVVIQRVSRARVSVAGDVIGQIAGGLCLFVGLGQRDHEANAEQLAQKILNLRIFEDAQGKMNLSIRDVGGEILAVSQFTLYADCSRGNRPSFTDAAPPSQAEPLYNHFVNRLRASGLVKVATGRFKARMDVSLSNDGPVTFILED